MKTAKRRKKGAKYFRISSMLLAYLTYEAYINFLGDRFASDVWKNEKAFFAKKPYYGLEGKLKLLSERIPIVGIRKGRRPYQTIKKLKGLRDFLSHGKTDKYEKTIIHRREKEPPLLPDGKLDNLITPELADGAVLDVRKFIEFLHYQAVKRTKDIWFGDDPLRGIQWHASADSRLNERTHR
jgi:hypothetical protein